ncbi:MAG: helix-turn-helix transcriptional regulator [Pseudomonadota bacterium]
MQTLQKIASTLRHRQKLEGVSQERLRGDVGVSRQTLTNVLSGEHDYKLTTLLAVADRLGFEMVLVPKEAASGLSTTTPTAPLVKTRVQAALERLETRKREDKS